MKKVYCKPIVFIEEFEISQNVAASACTVSAHFNKDTCGISMAPDFPNKVLFTRGGGTCTTNPVGWDEDNNGIPDDDDKYCYHIPTDTTRYFGS